MLRALALATVALALASGCSRTIPVTVERIQVQHGPDMTVTMQSDAELETSVLPEVQAFVDTALPENLSTLTDDEVRAVAQHFLDRYEVAYPLLATGAEERRTVDARSALVTERARRLLAERERLTPLQAERLDRILTRESSTP